MIVREFALLQKIAFPYSYVNSYDLWVTSKTQSFFQFILTVQLFEQIYIRSWILHKLRSNICRKSKHSLRNSLEVPLLLKRQRRRQKWGYVIPSGHGATPSLGLHYFLEKSGGYVQMDISPLGTIFVHREEALIIRIC